MAESLRRCYVCWLCFTRDVVVQLRVASWRCALVKESVRSQLGCSIHFGLVGVATRWYLASLNERH